ncbi:CRP-like cAMP-binding protein [Azospirillum agricola]|uniref:Crp/Fnr family transcriptional regulator n=1 Tax=Azospirillum agricola TaxID=1720247 RepID=UPI001AE7D3E2|nr:Crp/Fnr family transcriptional regulator [Azospirillum agricola]MBP2227980.1 CRP-like cAMP-binding protein [Azospirillum agricola]
MSHDTSPAFGDTDTLQPCDLLSRSPCAAGKQSQCTLCPAREHSVCRHIDDTDFDRLFPHGPHIQTRRAGSTLFHQGEAFGSVLIVRSGWALTHKHFEDGRRQIIRFVLPGDLLGFEGNEADGMAYGAEAITDVTLCSITHSVFFRTCFGSPQLAMNFAATVTREALAAWNHVGALGQQPAQGRIANLLLDLHQRIIARWEDERAAIHLPINQNHIAGATGLTSVHVCRTLKRMRQAGLLDFRKGQLVLLDTGRLAEVAQLDSTLPLAGLSKATGFAARPA